MRFFVVALGLSLCYLFAAVNAYIIEAYVSVDDAVKKHYRNGGTPENQIKALIRQDILYTMTAVNDLYSSLSSDGIDIKFMLSRLDVLDKNIFPSAKGNEILNTAGTTDFQNYLKREKIYDTLKYDIALHFTGMDLKHGKNSIAGYAMTDKVCDSEGMGTGIMTFEGTYKSTIFTVHEIGHLLGLYHDSGECLTNYVLSATVWWFFRNKYEFSPCSIAALKKNIVKHGKTCLSSQSPSSKYFNTRPSSQMLDGDTVCKRNGWDFQCKDKDASGDAVCKGITCSTKGNCYYYAHTTEGYDCGSGGRCRRGKCVGGNPAETAPKCRNDAEEFKCVQWQQRLECKTNPHWVGANCQKSCGTGHCAGNPTVPTPTCFNKYGDIKCTKWESDGECDSNKDWMRTNCNKGCGYCTEEGSSKTTRATSKPIYTTLTPTGEPLPCKGDSPSSHQFCLDHINDDKFCVRYHRTCCGTCGTHTG